MKRFIVMPCVGLLVLLGAAGRMVVNSQAAPELPAMLAVSPDLMPGNPPPPGCVYYVPEGVKTRYCYLGDLDLIVANGLIKHTDVFTYQTGLTVGILMTHWGTPSGMRYESDITISLYWPGRYAYAFAPHSFSPENRVGFVGYGVFDDTYPSWRGFISQEVK